MSQATIDRLIINSPYKEPSRYWKYVRETQLFDLEEGRRPAGYIVASPDSNTFDDPGVFVEIPLVNRIRNRVDEWRKNGYPGVTGLTKRLLEYWQDPEEFDARRFFFCQLEAVETLIWLREAPAAERTGIDVPSDSSDFERVCAKMATGSGKTVVMAMVIAWHFLNKAANPQDTRFSQNVLVVAPGLTVKSRLGVLDPSHEENYYERFRVVPSPLLDTLRRGKVIIHNWHALDWETQEQIDKKRSVDKRGVMSDEAYARNVLGEMARAKNLLVINDEAHHAWRVPPESTIKGVSRSEIVEATRWVGGLDRIHRARGILMCYDFSATPFAPSGKKSSEEALFGWIVSDFGLNDAIESGLVKTPRVVIRDDAIPEAKTYRSRLYHIYNDREVKDDLNRKALAHEPLPDLVSNGYYLLGFDWQETAKDWQKVGHPTLPVMITVANRTETAARVKYAFDHKRILLEALCNPERTLHIDSKVLAEAEAAGEPIALINTERVDQDNGESNRPLSKKQRAELLRSQVDTVGQVGKPGEHVQNVISVGMLSEGWDAKTVTHIMGLRAFTSQLLCEQVVGRGLRRTSYDVDEETGLFEPEYVNIFGVPFTFLPHETTDVVPQTPKPKTAVEPVADKAAFEITWPNVVRIEHVFKPRLSLDIDQLEPLELNASETALLAELAPTVAGKPDVQSIQEIDLKELAHENRMQRIIFETAREVYDQMHPGWPGSREVLLAQLVRLVEEFIKADRIRITPPLFYLEDMRRRLTITLNLTKVVQHIQSAIRAENTEKLEIVFGTERPLGSTGDMSTWYTGKPCARTDHSHVNVCVFDSTWEASEAFHLDRSPLVNAWVKNDHLGFEVLYVYRGVVRKYRPDFLIRLSSGDMLVLETKGQENAQDREKRRFLKEWVDAVNQHGEFGRWHSAVSYSPADIEGILHAAKRTRI